ncbi:MAG: 16S rRNA (guanine(527)-N(7))-methyltransferase RsmG [Dehalococcoidales bacterium]|nr:16S rRNA (guanine(527)-N(7))-methyltransferase RsmG [Dehalococcoidales bacterium]
MEKLYACAQKLGYQLNPKQLEQFSVYYQELVDWNQRINLTSITGYEEVQIKHFCDSITVTLALKTSIAGKHLRVLDVGSGAGFPGIPLKILLPGISLVLLESTTKKTIFLRHLKEKLGLDDVEIVTGRAEEAARLEQYRERFDIVLSRAMAPLSALVELTLPFCSIGGYFIAQKKGDTEGEISQAAKAIGTIGGSLGEIKRIELEEFADERYLIIIDKVSPTPTQYPRRPGMPVKRPIV